MIERRKPNIAAHIAKATGSVTAYLCTRGQDDNFYLKQITDYLMVNGEASRADINHLLLSKLRRRKAIVNVGSDPAPRWQLTRIRDCREIAGTSRQADGVSELTKT